MFRLQIQPLPDALVLLLLRRERVSRYLQERGRYAAGSASDSAVYVDGSVVEEGEFGFKA